MDTLTTEQRSRVMAKIRGRDTLPEIIVRKRLFAAGWRFRVCDKRFKGKPDIVIPKAKTIIDVRGCFWHRHGCKDSTMPKSNIAFWMEKEAAVTVPKVITDGVIPVCSVYSVVHPLPVFPIKQSNNRQIKQFPSSSVLHACA